MSIATKSTLKKKLVWILAAAVVITAIIPISALGSDGRTATIQFIVDGKPYGDEMSVAIVDEEISETESEEKADDGTQEFVFDFSELPDDPEKDGYTFVGWSDGTTLYTKEGSEQLKLNAEDVISLEAVFEKNPDSDNKVASKDSKAKDAKADNKSNELPNDNGITESYKVNFYSGNKVHNSQTITKGEVASMPENPELPEGMTAFKGWYTNVDGEGDAYDFSTPVTDSLSIFAVFTDNYLVYFKDAEGSIMASQEVSGGNTVKVPSENPEPLDTNHLFQYWFIENGDDTVPFDFSTKVYSNLTLVPKFNDEFTVFFESHSGKIDSKTVQNGSSVEKPATPKRTGYEFAFWSKDSSALYTDKSTKEYDFDSPINESFTLYAIWEGKATAYSVVYWTENANIKGDPGTDQKNYTYSGTVSVKANDSNYIAGHTLTESETEAMANSSYTSMSKNNKALKYSDFAFSSHPTLKGDGTSIVNVYYKRMEFTCTINLNKNNAKITFGGTDYVHGNKNYSFTAKYGEDISDKFPLDTAVTTTDNTVIDGWTCAANVTGTSETPHSTPTLFNEILISKDYKTNGRNYSVVAVWKNKNDMTYMWRQMYVSLTDHEKSMLSEEDIAGFPEVGNLKGANFPTSGATPPQYVKYTDTETKYGREIGNVTLFKLQPQLTMEGYAANNSQPTAYDHQSIGKITGTSAFDSGNMKGTSNNYKSSGNAADDEPNYLTQNNNNSQRICWYLYARNNVNINLNLQGGSLEKQNGTITLNDVLVDENAEYALKAKYDGEQPQPTKDEMEFDGWYLDSDYTIKLTDKTTVTYPGMELFAKYKKNPCSVEYFDKVGGNEITSGVNTSYEYGEYVKEPDVYQPGVTYSDLGTFIGWGFKPYKGSDAIMLFDFEKTPITKTITLYGIWKTDNFTVTYDAGTSTTLFYSAPVDNNSYKLNVKAQVLDIIDGLLEGFRDKKFVGWRIEGKGPIYYSGSNVKITGNINFEALYTEVDNMTKITYHPNYEGASDSSVTQDVMMGEQGVLLGDNTFKRVGYELVGWSTQKGSNTVEHDLGGLYTPTGETNFYAVWKEVKTFNVTFKIADGQEEMGNLTLANMEDQDGIELVSEADNEIVYKVDKGTPSKNIVWPDAATNEDYLFTGWNPTKINDTYINESLTLTASFKKYVQIDLSKDIEIDDKTKVYGNEDPELTYTLSGKLDQYRDDFNITLIREEGENVGKYNITATVTPKSEAVGYAIINEDSIDTGLFTVTPRPITITAQSYPQGKDVIYPTSTLPKFKADVDETTPLVNGDVLDYILSIKDHSGTGTPSAGEYEIVFNFDETSEINKNYSITTVDGTLTITESPADEPIDDTTTGGNLDMTTDPEQNGSLAGGQSSNPANNNTSGSNNALANNDTSAATNRVLADQAIADGLVPSTNIGDTDIPLYSNGLFDSWALINLILAIFGAITILAGFFKRMLSKNKEEDNSYVNENDEKEKIKRNILWLTAGTIFAIAGIILFILTQDMSQPMVMVDNWTIVNAVLFVLTLFSMIFFSKKNKNEDTDSTVIPQ